MRSASLTQILLRYFSFRSLRRAFLQSPAESVMAWPTNSAPAILVDLLDVVHKLLCDPVGLRFFVGHVHVQWDLSHISMTKTLIGSMALRYPSTVVFATTPRASSGRPGRNRSSIDLISTSTSKCTSFNASSNANQWAFSSYPRSSLANKSGSHAKTNKDAGRGRI